MKQQDKQNRLYYGDRPVNLSALFTKAGNEKKFRRYLNNRSAVLAVSINHRNANLSDAAYMDEKVIKERPWYIMSMQNNFLSVFHVWMGILSTPNVIFNVYV